MTTPVSRTLVAGLLALVSAASLHASTPVSVGGGDLAIVGGTVHAGDGKAPLSSATVLVRAGRIVAVGRDVAVPPGVPVLRADGMHVTPGFVAADTSLGLVEIGAIRATHDEIEVGALNPDLHAVRAVNPDSELLGVAMANGVLSAVVSPQGGLVSGLSAVIVLSGWTREDMTVRDPAALHVNWPSLAVNRAPDAKPPVDEQEKAHAAAVESLTDLVESARAYLAAAPARAKGTVPRADRDLKLEAMAPVLSGSVPVVAVADTVLEMRAAMAWARHEGVRLVISGGRDASRIAGEIASAGVPVLVHPIRALPARDDEPYDQPILNAMALRAAGVKMAFSVGGDAFSAAHVRNLPDEAAATIPWGMPPEEALADVTSVPAAIFGVADDLGTLAPGRLGDVVLWDGPPLETTSRVAHLVMRGQELPIDDRHTRLYHKYAARPHLGR